jgi:hypothetical protein
MPLAVAAALFGATAIAAPAPHTALPPTADDQRDANPLLPPDGVRLSQDDLASVSAGQSIYLAMTTQTLSALTNGQITAGTVQSGGINFSQNALQGFAGIGNFVLNTGNNNVLQGAISLTVAPTP